MLTSTIVLLMLGFINNYCSTEIEPLMYKGCQETMEKCTFQNMPKTINENHISILVEQFYSCQNNLL